MVWEMSMSPATHFSQLELAASFADHAQKLRILCRARKHTLYPPSNALVIRCAVDMSRLFQSIPELEPHLRPPCWASLNLP